MVDLQFEDLKWGPGPNPNIHALLLRAGPGSTLDYLSEKTKRDWVVPHSISPSRQIP